MKLSGKGKLLRIFIGESDRHSSRLLYEAMVLKAREHGMAGATVLRGIEGYGANSFIIHSAKILRLSEDLPVVVEVIDTEDRIREFLPIVDTMIEEADCGAMITIEDAEIIRYTHGSRSDTGKS
jgi:PII-like signaling protein